LELVMSQLQAAVFDLIHDYPGGTYAAAQRLGKAETTIRHEAKPPPGGFAKAGLLDVNKLMHSSNDLRVLYALCEEHGGVFIPMPQVDPIAGEDVRSAMARLGGLAKEFGDVMTECSAALADGRVSDNELHRVERQWRELVASGSQLVGTFTQLNAQLQQPWPPIG
jgi:hypothetical protein